MAGGVGDGTGWQVGWETGWDVMGRQTEGDGKWNKTQDGEKGKRRDEAMQMVGQ